MKARRVITLVLGVLLVCSSMTMAVPALNIYDIDEPYVYPIVPGTPEWAALDSRITKGEVCQIPEDILSRMTTSALLETVLDYPLLGDIYAWNSPEQGFSVLLNSFNGLSELVSRPDFAQVLETFDLEESAIAESTVSYKMMVAEMGRERLFDFAIKSPYITLSSEQTRAVVPPPIIEEPGYPIDLIEVTLSTHAGNTVYAFMDLPSSIHGATASEIARQESLFELYYPNAVKLEDADPKYNCHSFALYGLGSANRYWINDPSPFFTSPDDSFIEIAETTTQYPQYVYFYDNYYAINEHQRYIHSMVRVANNLYLSKWGFYGTYRHTKQDNPYYCFVDDQDICIPSPMKCYILNPDYDEEWEW